MVRCNTFDEKIVFAAINLTWLWYFLGALYIMAPVLAWLLVARLVAGWLLAPDDSEFRPRPIPVVVWVWIASMLMMQVALVIGHINFGLSTGQTIKSSIGWAKGWALLAIFPLLGACLNIRPAILYRAAGLVAAQTLIFLPLMLIAPMIGLPSILYTSPLKVVGGPGPEFFEIQLYGLDPSGNLRWRFFTPWATAAAVAYGMLFAMVLRDRSNLLIGLSTIAVLAVAIMCKSRLGFVAIPVALILAELLGRLTSPRLMMTGCLAMVVLVIFGPTIAEWLTQQKQSMEAMRADSTYVREALGQIALHRWETEAPIWGHGIVEMGPHIVEFMPIGSHHSWYGLLFTKGIVGFAALLIPLIATVIDLIARAQQNANARAALAFMLLFSFFTFTENVEILAYLMWPGLMLVGLASSQRFISPFRRFMAGGPISQDPPTIAGRGQLAGG